VSHLISLHVQSLKDYRVVSSEERDGNPARLILVGTNMPGLGTFRVVVSWVVWKVGEWRINGVTVGPPREIALRGPGAEQVRLTLRSSRTCLGLASPGLRKAGLSSNVRRRKGADFIVSYAGKDRMSHTGAPLGVYVSQKEQRRPLAFPAKKPAHGPQVFRGPVPSASCRLA